MSAAQTSRPSAPSPALGREPHTSRPARGSAGTTAAPLVSHDAGTRRPSTAGDTSGAAPGQGCTAPKHGNLTAYKLGCRCPGALVAGSRSQKRYRLRHNRGQRFHVEATGTRRRLQALAALGWRAEDLGVRLGVTGQAVSMLQRKALVYPTTAQAVARLYDELADHRGPSEITARRAKAAGWLVPLWWDDDTIDDPTYVPKTTQSKAELRREDIAERQAEVGRLSDRGLSAAEIAVRLDVTPRQVERYRLHNNQQRALEEAS